MIALEDLISRTTTQNHVAVVFYSGHGGLIEEGWTTFSKKRRWRYQFLVPIDFSESEENDWRGITDTELSYYMNKLSQRTPNVSLILDCCHAARMSRDSGSDATLKVVHLSRTTNAIIYKAIRAHLEALGRSGQIVDNFIVERNPMIVCIAAATADQAAWEDMFLDGRRMGVFTHALCGVLDFLGSQTLSWRSLMLEVAHRVLLNYPDQHPQLDGPNLREIFTTNLLPRDGLLSIVQRNQYILCGGILHNVDVGDIYTVMPIEFEKILQDRTIAKARVVRVGVKESLVDLDWAPFVSHLDNDRANALPSRKAERRLRALFTAPEEQRVLIKTGIEQRTSSLYVAEAEDNAASFAKIECRHNWLQIMDAQEHVIRQKQISDEDSWATTADDIVDVLSALAKASNIRILAQYATESWRANEVTITCGRVVNGTRSKFGDSDHRISEGEFLYVDIHNKSAKRIFVSIFDVCLDHVELLSTSSRSGLELPSGFHFCVGEVDLRKIKSSKSVLSKDLSMPWSKILKGCKMSWPEKSPKLTSIPETIIAIITNRRIDLSEL